MRMLRRSGPVAVVLGLTAGVMPFEVRQATAIPTLHEITANWAGGTPANVLLGKAITGEWHINTNDQNVPQGNAPVSNVRVSLTATNGIFASIPSACKTTGVTPVSTISPDGTTLACNLGTVNEGAATVLQAPMRATDVNGGKISATGFVTSDSNASPTPVGPASLPPVQIIYTNGLDINLQYAPQQRFQGATIIDGAGNARQNMLMNWSVILKDGSRAGPASYTFPVKISSATPGAKVTGLRFEACTALTTWAQFQPFSGPQADRANFPTCAVTGTNLNYNVTLSGLDYSLTKVPVNDSLGDPLPGGGSYIASGTIRFSIPGTTPVTATYSFAATPPNVTFAGGQVLAEGPKPNNSSAATLYVPGEFSNAWHGTPANSRSVWDDQLLVTRGTSLGVPLPAADGTTANPLPLYSQATSYAWNDYTGAGGTNVAGVCTMKSHPSFVYDKADFFAYNPGIGYLNMTTATLWYRTGAINTKTDLCNTGSWVKLTIPPGAISGDPRTNGTNLVSLPANVSAIRVLWNPKIDKGGYIAVRGFGHITTNAAAPSEGWTVGSFNAPTHGYWNYSNTNINGDPTGAVTETPWSTYANLANAGTNGYRDVYRVQGYLGIISKVAGDTSAPPGVPVTYTIKAQAQTGATSPTPVTFTVTDTLPAGLVYVAGSGVPTPSQNGQVLTWTFPSAVPNVDKIITYQAQVPLGSVKPPGTELTNTAQVNVPGDLRPAADKQAHATVVIPNNGSTTLGKSAADNVLSFYGDTSFWSLVINSFDPSSNTFTDTIDILPYKGDPRGTNIDGAYTVTTVTAPASSKIYYTTAAPGTLSADPRNTSNGTAPGSIVGQSPAVNWTLVKPAKPTAIRVIGPALAPGSVQTIKINFTTPAGTNCVTPAALDNKPAQKLVNSATTLATHTGLPMISSAQTVIGDCYAMDLKKSVLRKGGDTAVENDWHDANSVADYQQYAVGDTAQYRIVVTNKGTGTLTNIPVVDDKFPACNTVIPSLAAGASQAILCSGVLAVGTTVNTASANLTPPDGPPLVPTDPAGVVVPELFKVSKVSNPPTGATVNPGDVINYTITVTEPATSPAPYGNPSLIDDLSDVLDSADYVTNSVSATAGTVAIVNGVLNWSAPLIVPGQTVTITYSVIVKPLGPDDGDGDLVNGVTGGTCIVSTDPLCTSTQLIPSYTVAKSAVPATGTTVSPGGVVTYNVVVTNTGPVAANATITDSLSAVLDDGVYNNDAAASAGPVPTVNGSTLSWSKTLAVNEVVTLTYSVTIKPSASLGDGQLDNVVTATGPTTSCLVGEQGSNCRTHHDVAAVRYEKVVNDPGVLNIGPGDDFTYTITARNVGNVDLVDIQYTDDLTEVIDDAIYNNDASADIGSVAFNAPDELVWSTALLAVGETATITYTVEVDNVPGGNNVLINSIIGTGPGSNCVDDPVRPECITQVPKPLLESKKEIIPPSVTQADGTITYRITTSNIGADIARTVPILDDMSDALDAAVYNGDASVVLAGGATTTSLDYQAPELLWVGDIPVLGTVTITYTMTVNGIEELGDDGTLTNFLITADCPDPAVLDPLAVGYDADCLTVTPIPAYIVEKTSVPADGSTTSPGIPVTYTLTIRNTGGVALNPTITDDLSGILDDATYVSSSATASAGPIPLVDLAGEELTWTGPLAIDGVVTLTYQMLVDPADALGNGKLHNTVSGDGPNNCVAPIVTDPQAPGYDARCVDDIDIEAYTQVKSSIPPAGSTVNPGDIVQYTVTIENTGGVALTPTIFDDLSDVLDDASYQNDAASDSGPDPVVDPTNGMLTWTGPFAVGETIHLTYSVTVNEGDALGNGKLANVTTGTGPSPCPTTGPANPQCETEHLIRAVVIKKVITNPNVLELQPGDSFTYTVTAENTGQVAAGDVTWQDTLDEVLDDASLTTGPSTDLGTATFTPGAPGTGVLDWIGDLAVGETSTTTYTVTINDPIGGDGVLINAVVGENCPDPAITDPANPAYDPDCSKRVPQPLLDTVKTIVTPTTPQAGNVVTYQITTTNTGVGPALGVVVEDDLTEVLDDAVYLGTASVVGGGTLTYDEPVLSWTGDIAAGASIVVTYTVQVNPLEALGDGTLLNTITGPGCPTPPITDPQDPLYDDECLTVTSIPAYTIEKSSVPATGSTVLPGDTVDYTLTITNVGGQDLTPTITDNLTGVTDDAVYNGDVASTTAPTPVVAANLLTWTGPLPVDGTVTITYSVTVKADAAALGDAKLGNVVGGTGPTNCTMPPITDETDPLFDPRCVDDIRVSAYTVVKSSTPVSGTPLSPGDTITYKLTIVNTGGVTVSPVINDDLSAVLDDATFNPPAEEADPATTPTLDEATQQLTWSAPIPVGQTVILTYSVTIKPLAQIGDFKLKNVVTTVGPESPCPPSPATPNASCETEHVVMAVRYEKSISNANVLLIQPGDTFTYTVTATNIGEAPLVGLTFTDVIGDNVLDDATYNGDVAADTGTASYTGAATTIDWAGDLAVDEVATITYSVTVNDPISGDGILLNKIVGTGPSTNCADLATLGPECTTVVPQPLLESAKTVIEPSDPVAGGTLTYQIVVSNVGPGPALSVNVGDDMSGALDDAAYNDDAESSITGSLTYTEPTLRWIGDIPSMTSVTITYTMTVNPLADLGDGTLVNKLTTPDCQPPDNDPDSPNVDEDCVTITPIPGYLLNKSSDPSDGAAVKAGDTVTYTVVATNVGGVDLIETIIDDLAAVLDDATYNHDAIADSGPTPTFDGTKVTWLNGPLLIGGTVTITYSVTIKAIDALGNGALDNVVTGTGENPCKTVITTAPCATHHPVAAWDLVKTADKTTVVPGSNVTYTIVARNVGTADLTGLTYDDNMTGVLDDAVYNGDATATIGGVSYAAPKLTWTGNLAVGQQSTVTYTMTVNAPLTGDHLLTNVVLTDEEGPCPPNSGDQECDVDLSGRQLTIGKATVPANIASVKPGDTVRYRVTITNTGAVAYTPATAVDDLTDALDAASGPNNIVVTGPGSASFDAGAQHLVWTGPLQPAEVVTIDYELVVDSPLAADGWLENVVTSPDPGASCPTSMGAVAFNSVAKSLTAVADGCMTATPIQSMRVLKESNPGSGTTVEIGTAITYTVTVTNTGQAVLTPAAFTDDLSDVLDDADLEGTPSASSGTINYAQPVISWSGDLGVGGVATITYVIRLKAGGDGRLDNVVVGNGPGTNCSVVSDAAGCATFAVLAVPPPETTTTQPEPTSTTVPPSLIPPGPVDLPNTGADTLETLRIVGLSILAGTALVLISRRRRRARA